MSSLLRFEGVSFGYGRRKVLAGVEFSIEPGACTALIGPNGGGKTTLLRLAAGLLRPSAGQVLYEGATLHSRTRRDIAQRIALVPQALEIPFPFTVQQIVEQSRTPYLGLFGGFRDRDRSAVERAVEFTGIGPLRHRIFNELSGGERQRVALARALATNPKMLLLDEPTEGIQPSIIRDLARTLKRIRDERGLAILVSEQVLSFALDVVDRLFVLEGGRIVHTALRAEVDETEVARFLAV